jgi:hypothetical protein
MKKLFEVLDEESGSRAELTLEGNIDSTVYEVLLQKLERKVQDSRILEGKEEEIRDDMTQKQFEAARAAMEEKKRKKRNSVDLQDVRITMANKKRNSPEETLRTLRNRMKSQRA